MGITLARIPSIRFRRRRRVTPAIGLALLGAVVGCGGEPGSSPDDAPTEPVPLTEPLEQILPDADGPPVDDASERPVAEDAAALLDCFHEATGGDAAREALRVVFVAWKLRFAGAAEPTRADVWVRAPEDVVIDLHLPGGGRMREAVVGGVAWVRDATGRERRVDEARAHQIRRQGVIDLAGSLRAGAVDVIPLTRRPDQDAATVARFAVVDEGGGSLVVTLDRGSCLPVAIETDERRPEGMLTLRTTIRSWTRIGDLLVVESCDVDAGGRRMTQHLTRWELNPPDADAAFNIPPALVGAGETDPVEPAPPAE